MRRRWRAVVGEIDVVVLEETGEGGNEDGVRRGCRVLLILDLESAV